MKTQHQIISCIYCDETVGSDLELDKHKMFVHKITIHLKTKSNELPNGRVEVTTMKTEEDDDEKFLFFSRSTIIKDMKKMIAVENYKEEKQFECIQCKHFFLKKYNLSRHVKSQHKKEH